MSRRNVEWVPSGYLTIEQVKKLLGVIRDKRNLAVFTLAYGKGMRAGEPKLLQLSDLRMDVGRVFIHRLKGSVSAEHKLNPDELRTLRAYLKERGTKPGPLFLTSRGTGVGRKMIAVLMNKYRELAKLPVEKNKCGFRILKHSIATTALETTRNVKAVQDLLGHKDIRNTLVYAKLTDAVRDETVDKVYEVINK